MTKLDFSFLFFFFVGNLAFFFNVKIDLLGWRKETK